MPDGTPARSPGRVIAITPEDRPNVTAQRLRAAGADMGRVLNLTRVNRGYTSRAGATDDFQVPDDLPLLYEAIHQMKDCRLVWISPLSEASSYPLVNAVTVRKRVIGPLRRVAEDTGVAIVVVGHLTKAGVIGGSGALVQACRSVVWVQPDPAKPTVRVALLHKTNLADDTKVSPLRWTFVGEGSESRVSYLGQNDGEDALDAELPDEREPRPGTARAVILSHLRGTCACQETSCGGLMTTQELYAVTDIPHLTVRGVLRRLVHGGWAASTDRGLYEAVTVTTAADQAVSPRVTVTRGRGLTFPGHHGA